MVLSLQLVREKAGLKSAETTTMGLCAMTSGMSWMPEWCAISWDLHLMVRVICATCLCNKLEVFFVLEMLLHSKQELAHTSLIIWKFLDRVVKERIKGPLITKFSCSKVN